MEQEYIDTLLKDIDKSKSSDEKIHLLTVFISELVKSDKANKKAISDMSLTLELSAEANKSLVKGLEIISERFQDIDNYLSVNADQALRTAENVTRNTERFVDVIEDLGKIYEHIGSLNNSICLLMDRIEVLE